LHDDDAGHHGGRAREAHCERLPPPVRVRRSGKAERLDGAARMALECLGKSDALYHNVEHTFLVTLAGQDILHGRMLTERLEPDDYSHLIVACLLHDIGYVRGILTGDGKDQFVVVAVGQR
jgi:hypothetical protein